jgi:hypothetical protein
MPRPVTALRNLGPSMAAAFARAGIGTAEEIEAQGAEAAYAALLASGHRPHFMAFLALALGLQGRPFNDLTPAEKVELRTRFDAVVTAARADGPPPGIEVELDRLGVGPRR